MARVDGSLKCHDCGADLDPDGKYWSDVALPCIADPNHRSDLCDPCWRIRFQPPTRCEHDYVYPGPGELPCPLCATPPDDDGVVRGLWWESRAYNEWRNSGCVSPYRGPYTGDPICARNSRGTDG